MYIGGRIQNFIDFWKDVTQDNVVLDYVRGVQLEFDSMPVQDYPMPEIRCSQFESEAISGEIEKYLELGIISPVYEHIEGEYVSKIFPRPKKDGGWRIILDLSPLNKDVVYEHFKMESFKTAMGLVTENCFFGSIDLKDAYYSVNINPMFRKFLRFTWKGQMYEFNCLPNGYSAAPRIFTKIIKTLFAKLRAEGFISVFYLDDSLLIANSFEHCHDNIMVTSDTLSKAGFIINQKKSVFEPVQEIKFLGFILNSVSMTVTLPEDKKSLIHSLGSTIMQLRLVKIRLLAKFIGHLVASLPAVSYGELFYRYLELNKIDGLAANKGNFESFVSVSTESKKEIQWWLDNIKTASKSLISTRPDLFIETDASGLGWGVNFNGQTSQGFWLQEELSKHINVLELKAALLGLQSFCNDFEKKHIRLKLDNTTAVAYINNLGGVKSIPCHKIAKEIWLWALERNIHLSAEHLPGSENVIADKASRVLDDNTEWELVMACFLEVNNNFGPFDIDLFASRLNKKVETYSSWKPDPYAKFIDAFSADWREFNFYAFPPFSLVLQCLEKIRREQSTGTMIVPLWPGQPWFPIIISMLTAVPLILPLGSLVLSFRPAAKHKLHKTLRLVACPISGDVTRSEAFQRGPLISCVPPGEPLPRLNTKFTLRSGIISVVQRKLIPCHLMNHRF